MKLTHLRIHRYRDVVPGTALAFSPALNLVLGDNGTGRTTLLALLGHVLAADFSSLLHEEFSLEYTLDFPGMDVHLQVRNERPATPAAPESVQALARGTPGASEAPLEPFMCITLALHAPDTRLVLRANAEGVAWEVNGQPDYTQKMYWSLLDRTAWVVLFLASQRLAPGHKERLKELLRRTFLLAPARFDEALGGFERIGQSQYAMETRGEDVFPLGLMSLPTWLPGLLRERAPRAAATGFIDVRHDEGERTFLARFVALAGLSAGRFRVELLDRRSWEDGGRLEFGRFHFTFTRRDGTLLSGEHLGHGQKRLLSLLYYLDVNEDFVLADELANGLHPRWVEAVVRELHGRQAFVTSQNPLLFDYVAPGDSDELRTSLIHCTLAEHAGRECKAWHNAPPDVSARLFGDYARGGTPLATLLRLHGLW